MRPGLPTDVDRWRQIETILDQALELPADERGPLLAAACAGDPALLADVEALLAADAAAAGFLGLPAGEYAPDLLAETAGDVGEDEVDLAGRQVGPYRLLREVGSGGMGTVYEAEDVRLGRRVAVKLLPPELGPHREAKERFLREARTASAVDHPNLCTVHDVGESEGRLYIVFSLYEGETLRERIRRGALPPAEAREVLLQVARGLARAHEAGIVHRDLKPANVMLTRRGEAKVLDFGIARLEGDEGVHPGSSWGTPAYMSPEQAGGGPVDRRTDVWSLGVLLYEMVAGRRPFAAEGGDPEPLERVCPELPPDLARVAARALIKDPAGRYASAAELLADLEAGPEAGGGRRLKGLPDGLLAGALTVLLALPGFAAWWLLPGQPSLRVAVLRPKFTLTGNNPDLPGFTSDVTQAVLGALTSLESVQPLDAPEDDRERGSQAETLRAREADEAILPLLDCRDNLCRLNLRRLARSGEVLATVGPFEIETGIENAHLVAEGMQAHLQELYPHHPPRPESPGKTRPQDYTAYFQLEHRVDRGEHLGALELAQLDSLLQSSPGLLGAWLLAASTARLAGDVDRARGYAKRAQELAPYDPQPLFVRLRIEVQGNRFDAAQGLLEELARRAPDDLRVLIAKADLLERQGDPTVALPLRQQVAGRRPTWRHVLELTNLETELGESASARQRLDALLAEQPDNQYARQHLAALEAESGDLKRAEALYEDLIRVRLERSDLTNLGFVRFLLGNYAGAVDAYRQALQLEPDHLLSRFNLATALEALGDLALAQDLYRTLATEFAATPHALDPHIRLLHAQCLVRLEDRAAGARILSEVLEKTPEDKQTLHQVAQLYALLGDRDLALRYTELALRKGLRREWFTIPEFRSLQEDPDFRALLQKGAPVKAAS